MLPIETERLFLRDFVADDFEDFCAISNAAEAQKYYAVEEMTRAFQQELLDQFLRDALKSVRTKYQLAICLRSGTLFGTCGVRLENVEHRQASFGCGIAYSYWGKGYAYEAAAAIIEFGFSKLSLERIYAETISENVRVHKLLERLGMRKEGEFVHHKFFRGRWWNTTIYGILKEEWTT